MVLRTNDAAFVLNSEGTIWEEDQSNVGRSLYSFTDSGRVRG